MVVKVVPPGAPHSLVAAEYFDVGDSPVSTGKFWFVDPPDRRSYGQIADTSLLHILGIDDDPITEVTGAQTAQWPVRWAHWFNREGRLIMVVTSGDIYVMSNEGNTIDRVR